MTERAFSLLSNQRDSTVQWKAETLQLVNWGGFHGYHEVRLSKSATLLSGASGTGKSTLLDAYLALMMPSDTPFNGASNDATTGRARSADQRNLLTYLRGKTDSNREAGTDELRDQVLRGRDAPTWGALAMTFIDDNERRYTVLRMYFVPRAVVRSSDITMKMATKAGYLDIRELTELANTRFDKRAVRTRFTGMEVYDTYAAFAQNLHTRLGIGANGDGSKALRLLSRIQTGQQVKTVDGLYKSMALEEPATYQAADRAIAHFTDLEQSYQAMVTENEKAKVLARLPELYQDFEDANAGVDLIDVFGVDREGDTPFVLWRLHTHRLLLNEAAEVNRRRRKEEAKAEADARELKNDLDLKLFEVRQQQHENGGDALERLKLELAGLKVQLGEVERARTTFDHRISPLHVSIDSEDEFTSNVAAAEAFLDAVSREGAKLDARLLELAQQQVPLETELRVLREELAYLSGREGLVPRYLHEARVQIAEATGLSIDELPFVAELIDIAPGEEKWRRATEVVLAAVARVMLFDKDHLDEFSRRIDPVHLPVRINFEGVPTKQHAALQGDPRRISGKLIFKESPFSCWVQDRVQAPNIDALCVDSPSELGRGGLRVLPSGQTRDGRRGAHGESRERNIIGFSNKARKKEISQEIDGLVEQLDGVSRQRGEVSKAISGLKQRADACRWLVNTTWPSIDVASVQSAIERKEEAQRQILSNNDVLQQLQAEETRLTKAHEEAQKAKHLAEKALEDLREEHGQLATVQDAVGDEIERIERAQSVALSAEHVAHLDAEFLAATDERTLAAFEPGVRRMRKRLLDQSKQEAAKAAKAQESMTTMFVTFKSRWSENDLGVTMASYPNYRDIRDKILNTGLHERRREWKRRLSEWSGQDLVPLNGAFDTAIEDIEDRLLPVNDILATLPFGAGKDRLRITLRRLHRDDIAAFRKELRLLSSGTTDNLTDDQTEQRFTKLQAFMSQIRKPTGDAKTNALRDYFLDVRKHVEITAVRTRTDGVEVSTYSALGGKSGGETQELVAFIVGAALRFQLGDESRTRPRFAPVILDEGFIKSDSEFAGRAVSAWKGLGFQLIIGAPLDKVTALEPFMDLVLSMTKDPRTGYSFVTPLASTSEATG